MISNFWLSQVNKSSSFWQTGGGEIGEKQKLHLNNAIALRNIYLRKIKNYNLTLCLIAWVAVEAAHS